MLKREGLLALAAIPMQHNGKVVAILNVGSRTGGRSRSGLAG